MLARDGFGIGARIAEELLYLSLAGEKQARGAAPYKESQRSWPTKALAQLARRIAWFKERATRLFPAGAALPRRHRRRL